MLELKSTHVCRHYAFAIACIRLGVSGTLRSRDTRQHARHHTHTDNTRITRPRARARTQTHKYTTHEHAPTHYTRTPTHNAQEENGYSAERQQAGEGVHLTIKDVVYEVDVKPKKEDKKATAKPGVCVLAELGGRRVGGGGWGGEGTTKD